MVVRSKPAANDCGGLIYRSFRSTSSLIARLGFRLGAASELVRNRNRSGMLWRAAAAYWCRSLKARNLALGHLQLVNWSVWFISSGRKSDGKYNFSVMVHLTLNLGKSNHNPDTKLSPELNALARSFLDKGGGSFPAPYAAYRIETDMADTGVAFYYFKGKYPISLCLGTWSAENAAEYWTDIEDEYRSLFQVGPQLFSVKQPPKMPEAVPWLATLLLPDFFIRVKSDSPDVLFLNTSEVFFFLAARRLARSGA